MRIAITITLIIASMMVASCENADIPIQEQLQAIEYKPQFPFTKICVETQFNIEEHRLDNGQVVQFASILPVYKQECRQ